MSVWRVWLRLLDTVKVVAYSIQRVGLKLRDAPCIQCHSQIFVDLVGSGAAAVTCAGGGMETNVDGNTGADAVMAWLLLAVTIGAICRPQVAIINDSGLKAQRTELGDNCCRPASAMTYYKGCALDSDTPDTWSHSVT